MKKHSDVRARLEPSIRNHLDSALHWRVGEDGKGLENGLTFIDTLNLLTERLLRSVEQCVATPPVKLLPPDEWGEDMGDVLWWVIDKDGNPTEHPWVGSPLSCGYTVEAHTTTRIISQMNQDSDPEPTIERISVGGWVEDYYTHFSLIQMPGAPSTARGAEPVADRETLAQVFEDTCAALGVTDNEAALEAIEKLVSALRYSTDLMDELSAGYIPGSPPNLRDEKRREEQIAENRELLDALSRKEGVSHD